MDLQPDEVERVARAAARHPRGRVRTWWTEPIEHPGGTLSTAALYRMRGVLDPGATPWSVVVKVLRAHRHVPIPLPVPAHLPSVAALSWRHEPDFYRAGLADVLPPGMRPPAVHLVRETDDEHAVECLEDVRLADADWDRSRYARAARLLGQLAARLTRAEPRLPPSFSRAPGEILRLHYLERELLGLPALRGDAVWAHPLVVAAGDPGLRCELTALADRVPALLDALPQRYVHGDASPQNLLVPADDPDGFVAIDWSLIGPAVVGFDLSQLVVGRIHTGQLPAAALGSLIDTVVAAYVAGLADEDDPVPADMVRAGFVGSLVVRSAFSALPLARLVDPPDPALAALVVARVRLTRHLVDLAATTLPIGSPS